MNTDDIPQKVCTGYICPFAPNHTNICIGDQRMHACEQEAVEIGLLVLCYVICRFSECLMASIYEQAVLPKEQLEYFV